MRTINFLKLHRSANCDKRAVSVVVLVLVLVAFVTDVVFASYAVGATVGDDVCANVIDVRVGVDSAVTANVAFTAVAVVFVVVSSFSAVGATVCAEIAVNDVFLLFLVLLLVLFLRLMLLKSIFYVMLCYKL